jgi:hypothetical protein
MTAYLSGGRVAFVALAALSAITVTTPAAAYIAPGPGTYFENFDNFPSAFYYLEDALPGAYVTDGYAMRAVGCPSGCDGVVSSYDRFAAFQIDFYQPQNYVSFTNVSTVNGVHAWAYSYLYGTAEPKLLDEIIDIPLGGVSNGVLTLTSPDPLHAQIFSVIFYHVGLSTYAIDNLAWSTDVPEPATWGMMLGGFGMLGGALRSNRRRLAGSFVA